MVMSQLFCESDQQQRAMLEQEQQQQPPAAAAAGGPKYHDSLASLMLDNLITSDSVISKLKANASTAKMLKKTGV